MAGEADLAGAATMRIATRRIEGPRWRVRTSWRVEAGEASFTARARGVVNFRTRRVTLDGAVVSGFLTGGEVHVRGRVANRRTRRLAGALTIVPHHDRTAAAATSAGEDRAVRCADPCMAVTVVRHGEGLVTSTFGLQHGAITCGTVCDGVFQSWTEKTIILTATGEAFSHWRDCPMPDGNRCIIDFDSRHYCVHAFFTPDENAPATAGSCATTTLPIVVEPPTVDTTITAGPSTRTVRTRAVFRFGATTPGATFRCKLDGRPWASCASPKTYRRLTVGRHVFRVVARDAQGNFDPTPAVRRWRITAAR